MENQEKEVKDFVINYTDGSSVTVDKGFFCNIQEEPGGVSNLKFELVITTDKEKVDGWAGGMRSETYINLTEVPQILKDLGIITDDMKENSEWLSADADLEEAIPFVGGGGNGTSHAGPSALSLNYGRSSVRADLGFFSACLGEPVRR